MVLRSWYCPCFKTRSSLKKTHTIVSAFLAVWVSVLTAPANQAFALSPREEGLFITQIALDPINSKDLYVLTTYSIGVLKSTDGGKRWIQINQGIRSYSLYQLTVHPKKSNILYLGAGGAGLYKSNDRGSTWIEMNDGLGNTDIGTLVLHPNDPEIVYIVTSTGLFKSPDGGKSWIALNQGDDFTASQQFQSLIVLPTMPPTFYLASGKGLYTRQEGDTGWVPVPGLLEKKQISALAHDPRTGRLYAAVFRRGTTKETLNEGGLFVSDDAGKSWSRFGKDLERDWIRVILLDPTDPQTLYLATSGRGVLKSADAGESWKEINVGLDDPDRDIRALVMDPHNSKVLYAGSHGQWIFRSRDGGAVWEPLSLGPHQKAEELLVGLEREDALVQKGSKVHPPAVLEKCNQCHGWTDSNLNTRKGNWRVPANRRNWALTVKRMSKGAGLTPDEGKEITDFLQTYSEKYGRPQ